MKPALKSVMVAAALAAAATLAQAQPAQQPAPKSLRAGSSPESVTAGGVAASNSRNPAESISTTGITVTAPVSRFAPAFTGDGQTDNWRIIGAEAAGRKPWTAVGNFLIPGIGGYCSAVLVAPRIVLTANHCLYALDYNKRDAAGNPGRQLMDATRFVFVAGVHDSAYADRVPVEEVITGGWAPGAEDPSRDWAIAILERPASSDIVPIAFKSYDPKAAMAAWNRKLMVAAYPGASFTFNSVLRFSLNCSILQADTPALVVHDCASENGSSGAPILVEEQGELRIIGIHSSRRTHSRARNGVSVNTFLAQLNSAVARFQ
jgi:protease YdgD